jgi:hypothetical protein
MITAGKDVEILKSCLSNNLTTSWDGKSCILELKEANYNWRQMEWWAFYFEFKVRAILRDHFQFPGDKFNNVSFDMKGALNWDLKASAVESGGRGVILNDRSAMEQSIEAHGVHGEIIALFNVEYDDSNRTFQKWLIELKGGMSDFEKKRELRTPVSRRRKTKANLTKIVLLILRKETLGHLKVMRQGRNSNGTPRREKCMFDLKSIGHFENHIIKI